MTDHERYDGAVVFVDGVHYPVGKDGHADKRRGLRVADGGGYRFADDDEPRHNDTFFGQSLELDPGGED